MVDTASDLAPTEDPTAQPTRHVLEVKIDRLGHDLANMTDRLGRELAVMHDLLREVLTKSATGAAQIVGLTERVQTLDHIVRDGNGTPSLLSRTAILEAQDVEVRSMLRDMQEDVHTLRAQMIVLDRDGSTGMREFKGRFEDQRDRDKSASDNFRIAVIGVLGTVVGAVVSAIAAYYFK